MPKHPNIMPDEMVRKLATLAGEHGYGIENLCLNWRTSGLGFPVLARAEYGTDDMPDIETLDSGPVPKNLG